VKKVKVM